MNANVFKNDFCFCTLALGERYQLMAKDLAQDLENYAPRIKIVIGTDNPKIFKNCDNIIPFSHFQTGILHCFNDKRFVIAKTLLYSSTAIYIDADTRIINNISESVKFLPGITGYSKKLLDHVNKYRPENLEKLKKISAKLNIPIETVNWIGESLFAVTKDQGKEQDFLETWGLIATYLELKGIHSGEGNIMGLAATKVGWEVQKNESLVEIDRSRKHLDASLTKKEPNQWENWKTRITYHYRLNKTRLKTLNNFDFYYR